MEKTVDEIHALIDEAKQKVAEIGTSRPLSIVVRSLDDAKLWLREHVEKEL